MSGCCSCSCGDDLKIMGYYGWESWCVKASALFLKTADLFPQNWVTGALGSFASWAVELRSFLKWTTSTLSAPLSRLNPFCKILQQQNQKCKSTNSTSIGLKMKQRNQIPAKGREAELQIIPLAAICRAQLAILSPAAAIDKRRMWMGQAHAILPLMLLWLQLLSAQELCAGSDFC